MPNKGNKHKPNQLMHPSQEHTDPKIEPSPLHGTLHADVEDIEPRLRECET